MLVALIASLTLSAASAQSTIVLYQSSDAFDGRWETTLTRAAEMTIKDSAEMTLIASKNSSLDSTLLMLGCADLSAACIGKIAELRGADQALVVHLRPRASSQGWLEFSMVDNKGDRLWQTGGYVLANRGAFGLATAKELTKAVTDKGPVTHLSVLSVPSGARVFVDGDELGQTPFSLVDRLAHGAHLVTLKLDGFADAKQSLSLPANRGRLLRKRLRRLETAEEPPANEERSFPVWAAATTSVGALVAIAGWVGNITQYWLLVAALEGDCDEASGRCNPGARQKRDEGMVPVYIAGAVGIAGTVVTAAGLGLFFIE